MENKNKFSSFKERYADPEYKLMYMNKYNIPIVCECGTPIKSKLNYSKHLKTKKHIIFMNFLKTKINAPPNI